MKPLLPCIVFGMLLHIGQQSPAATNANAQAMITSFLQQEAIRLDHNFLQGISNRQQWEDRREILRREYLEMLGLWPMPERTPLNARMTGSIDREEGFRIEKLHFQSRPKLYVTGNLYLPKDAKAGAKLPAVLYVCGHSGRGRDGNKTAFQHHGMWFATHGYACLLIDTLQLGEIAAIHHGTYRYNRWWWQARGYTPAAVECWNGIRAIDYLQSRPEVDPGRIAVTGISGGGAATFWIAAADERVKVAVPVSGISDLQDYVGEKVVNGHCDCMFLINTFQWPWTQIAALIAPRPLLFENSGHDTIFPMNGNDRIRTRLERLYGFYTNRTDRLFDIGIQPGGHDDKPELRLMAYRWINRFLKSDDSPVTEPPLPPIEGKLLRAFPEELPADELNTKIDESFVASPINSLPKTAAEFQTWRKERLDELLRVSFRPLSYAMTPKWQLKQNGRQIESGTLSSDSMAYTWKYFPGASRSSAERWIVFADAAEAIDTKPEWVSKVSKDAAVLLVATRGTGSLSWTDPPPYYVQRSLPLLGWTVDTCRVQDALWSIGQTLGRESRGKWNIAGRGTAGVIAAYATLMPWHRDAQIDRVALVDPPATHRDGPIFLNVLRVLDIPEALGLLAPHPLTIYTDKKDSFANTLAIYNAAGAKIDFQPRP
jgi:dienelactone hydrolase